MLLTVGPAIAQTVLLSPALDMDLCAPWAPDGAGHALQPAGLLEAKARVTVRGYHRLAEEFARPVGIDLRYPKKRGTIAVSGTWTRMGIEERDAGGRRLGEFDHHSYSVAGGIGVQPGLGFQVGVAYGIVVEQGQGYRRMVGHVLAGEVIHRVIQRLEGRVRVQKSQVEGARGPTQVEFEGGYHFEDEHAVALSFFRYGDQDRRIYAGYSWPFAKGDVALVVRGGGLVALDDADERLVPVGSLELCRQGVALGVSVREGTMGREGVLFQLSVR
jgi:hypothetical protein